MSNLPTAPFGRRETYNGEDCLIIPLKDIIEAQVTFPCIEQRPTVYVRYYQPSIIDNACGYSGDT